MRTFGEIEGIPEGTLFHDRKELHAKKVHHWLMHGISGSAEEGADCIVISGGYEDDEDYGDVIIYTGEGGRSEGSKKQNTNQTLTRGNMALAVSRKNGFPVRVVRRLPRGSDFYLLGFRYSYDGLFQVVDNWQATGRSGFKVWRYRLVKLTPGVPYDTDDIPNSVLGDRDVPFPGRKEHNVTSVIRDPYISNSVKKMYDYKCQICRLSIETGSGSYAEAAHIKALGKPHNGPDTADNILCLCPNHHTMFDYGRIAISEDLSVLGLQATRLFKHKDHVINKDYLAYHKEHYFWFP